MRILVTDGMDKTALEQLKANGHEVVEQFYAPEELGKALREFDAVVVRSATKVRANHIDEAKGGAQRALLFPDAGSFTQVTAPSIEGLNSVYQTDAGDYVFDVSATGYHGDVELMVGIASDGTVAGIQVVAEDETDGIGTNALTEDFFGTFTGLAATGTLTMEDPSSGETQVDGVSGATFTSNAVVADLNIAFEAYAALGGN